MCLQPAKAISRGVARRAANQRAELGAKGGWGDPLAGTGVERRPRTQEETQRPSHPVSLGVSLEPGGDREADLVGLGPSPADGGRTLPREPGWSQDAEGATAHLASPRAPHCHTRWLRLALGDLATGCLATWLLNADPITHTHAQSHMHTGAHACIHTCTNTRAYTHTCMNQLHAQIRTCTQVCLHMHSVGTEVCACAHTYTVQLHHPRKARSSPPDLSPPGALPHLFPKPLSHLPRPRLPSPGSPS